jgi:carbon-monoxide dehydrogenase medium subunit
MRPSNFDYLRSSSLDEAVRMLGSRDGAKALSGGHSLIPAMNLRLAQPDALVDIGRLSDLKYIDAQNGVLSIGARSTHAEIAASSVVRTHAPALASACGQVGDLAVRNWGTLGGNIAHADPASDPPTVLLAYGATINTYGADGSRHIGAGDFFLDTFTVDLLQGELITGVEISSAQNKRSAYVKFAHPASRYAVVGVCVVLGMNGSTVGDASVAVGGALPRATLSGAAANALAGRQLDDATLDAAANALMNEVGADVIGDVFAPADYRRAMVGVYFKKAVRVAMG